MLADTTQLPGGQQGTGSAPASSCSTAAAGISSVCLALCRYTTAFTLLALYRLQQQASNDWGLLPWLTTLPVIIISW